MSTSTSGVLTTPLAKLVNPSPAVGEASHDITIVDNVAPPCPVTRSDGSDTPEDLLTTGNVITLISTRTSPTAVHQHNQHTSEHAEHTSSIFSSSNISSTESIHDNLWWHIDSAYLISTPKNDLIANLRREGTKNWIRLQSLTGGHWYKLRLADEYQLPEPVLNAEYAGTSGSSSKIDLEKTIPVFSPILNKLFGAALSKKIREDSVLLSDQQYSEIREFLENQIKGCLDRIENRLRLSLLTAAEEERQLLISLVCLLPDDIVRWLPSYSMRKFAAKLREFQEENDESNKDSERVIRDGYSVCGLCYRQEQCDMLVRLGVLTEEVLAPAPRLGVRIITESTEQLLLNVMPPKDNIDSDIDQQQINREEVPKNSEDYSEGENESDDVGGSSDTGSDPEPKSLVSDGNLNDKKWIYYLLGGAGSFVLVVCGVTKIAHPKNTEMSKQLTEVKGKIDLVSDWSDRLKNMQKDISTKKEEILDFLCVKSNYRDIFTKFSASVNYDIFLDTNYQGKDCPAGQSWQKIVLAAKKEKEDIWKIEDLGDSTPSWSVSSLLDTYKFGHGHKSYHYVKYQNEVFKLRGLYRAPWAPLHLGGASQIKCKDDTEKLLEDLAGLRVDVLEKKKTELQEVLKEIRSKAEY